MKKRNIEIPQKKIAEFCRRHHIRRLALFGSALRDDFTPDSDVDVLVEFEPGTRVGMIRLAGIELEQEPGLTCGYELRHAGARVEVDCCVRKEADHIDVANRVHGDIQDTWGRSSE